MAVQKNTEGWKPIPDPTVLTTELTLREIANLKELLQSQTDELRGSIARIDHVLETRHAAIRDETDRVQHLFDEKFIGIAMQFGERDKRFAQQTESIRESFSKSEASFTKQIDQMQMIVNAIAKATDEKIDDLKTRLTMGEGKRQGLGEGWGIIVAAGGLATGILIAVASYIR